MRDVKEPLLYLHFADNTAWNIPLNKMPKSIPCFSKPIYQNNPLCLLVFVFASLSTFPWLCIHICLCPFLTFPCHKVQMDDTGLFISRNSSRGTISFSRGSYIRARSPPWHNSAVLSFPFHLPMLKRAFVFQRQVGRVCLSPQRAFEKAVIQHEKGIPKATWVTLRDILTDRVRSRG